MLLVCIARNTAPEDNETKSKIKVTGALRRLLTR